jgi:YggT family protein
MGVLCTLLNLVVYAIIAWIILSYVVVFGRIPWGHPVRRIYDGLSKGIDPILRPIRSVIPPLRMGGAALDLSPMILILGVILIARFIC